MSKEYTVRLNDSWLPEGKNAKHALKIAEELLHICGLIKIWEEPRFRHRIFYVRQLPQDVPQAGIHWINVDLENYGIRKFN